MSIESNRCIILFSLIVISKMSRFTACGVLLKNNKQTSNFLYEKFIIKIIAQIIRKFHSSSRRLDFLPIIDRIRSSLKEKDISYSILSYSHIYLALALYYIDCRDDKYTEYAKICFLHYKNLTTHSTS